MSMEAKTSKKKAKKTAPKRGSGGAGPVKRNTTKTKGKILKAARREFCKLGYNGARIQKIASQARINIRMIYHYFGSKEKLYLSVLESSYLEVRSKEMELNLEHLEPVEAMEALVEFTFTHLLEHPDFISLLTNENLLGGKYVRKSKLVPATTNPLVANVRNILLRGKKSQVFCREVDPIQLYITILSMCYIHLSNKYTLSSMFQMDLSDSKWLQARLRHVQDVVLCYLRHPDSS
jgi:AcrR family transcriptional regulator